MEESKKATLIDLNHDGRVSVGEKAIAVAVVLVGSAGIFGAVWLIGDLIVRVVHG